MTDVNQPPIMEGATVKRVALGVMSLSWKDPVMRPSAPRPLLALVLLGALLVGVGAVWFASIGDSSFGWFAYAPLSGATFPESAVVLSAQHRLALGTCVTGALLLSAAVGYAVGRRHARRAREQQA